MKVLHTSDWHLGRTLYGRKRYHEFTNFLDWLLQTITDEGVDVVLVAGDVFDTSTPSNRAQELYYRFLCLVASTRCHHVVIIAGNHDSPSFLNAPRALLRALNVHVIGSVGESSEDEVITLNINEQPQAIVCAVPYLRDRDLRTFEPGETIDSKNAKLIDGLKRHYAEVFSIAGRKQSELAKRGFNNIPLIGMGHLFASGGKTVEGDGVRELYVGSLARVGADFVPSSFNYMALGHLHVPQIVGGVENIRYCGSPIAMGYGEANQQKKVVLVEFVGPDPVIKEINVPCFQPLVRVVGSLAEIREKCRELKSAGSRAWLEVDFSANDIIGNFREVLDELLEDSKLEIRRVKNRLLQNKVMTPIIDEESLYDLQPDEVFNRCLNAFGVASEDKHGLILCHNEIMKVLEEDDSYAE